MRKNIKILSLLIVIILAFSCVAYAEGEDAKGNIYSESVKEELDYIDDIYRFDLNADEEEVYVEPIDDERAVFTVLCLGIMERMEDGSFSQDLPVSFEEFAKIVHYLSTGAEAGNADYSQYGDRNTTVKEAAEYLVKALGYGELAENSSAGGYIAMAKKLGLISGNINENKFVTRGELASMIYTALYTDVAEVTNFKSGGDYTITKGGKLINDRLNIFEIKGILSGVSGVNIYSTKVPDIERIEIDRVSYGCGDNDFSDLLGKYVFGYVRNSTEDEIPVVLGLTDDSKGRSITIKMSDVVDVGNDYIKYNDNDSEKKLFIDKIENVLYNGAVAENFVFTEELFENDGEIVFTSTKGSNKYNLAVIWARNSYRVRNISKSEFKLYFSDSLKFKGKEYVEFDDEHEENFLKIVKNGKVISFGDILKGDVISVIQSANGRYTHITVSQKIVMGKIDGRIDENITINGVEYRISKVYKDALKNPDAKAQELTRGTEGRFYLSADGTIAGFEGDDGISYGLLGKIGTSGGITNDLIIRLLTERGEWVNLYADKKLDFDGKKKVAAEDAYAILSSSNVFYKPIRYKVNANNEITFLDTVNETSEERIDQDSIKLSTTWTGTTHYTSPYVIFNENDSYYLYESVIFCIPEDKDDEDDFRVMKSTSLPDKTRVVLDLYNIDDVGRTPLIVYDGSIRSGGGSFDGRAFALESIKYVLNDDDEYDLKLSGYEQIHVSPGVGSWNKVEFKVDKAWLEEEPTLTFKPGDMFLYQVDSKGELVNREMLVRDNSLVSSSSCVIGDITWCFGTVTALDFSGPFKLVKITCVNPSGETMERTFVPRGVQIYDSQTETFESTTLEEYEIGDTILAVGNRAHVSVTVFR